MSYFQARFSTTARWKWVFPICITMAHTAYTSKTNEKVRIFTEMFEKRDILYNVYSRDYHNKTSCAGGRQNMPTPLHVDITRH